ncbi:hypothetical protein V2G26_003341 [Clonostachys chloroleuca]
MLVLASYSEFDPPVCLQSPPTSKLPIAISYVSRTSICTEHSLHVVDVADVEWSISSGADHLRYDSHTTEGDATTSSTGGSHRASSPRSTAESRHFTPPCTRKYLAGFDTSGSAPLPRAAS